MEFRHTSVLLNETIENLNIKPDGIYLDGTLGGGGHSYEIASKLGENGHLYGIDQDGDAIAAAGEHLRDYKERVTILRDNYVNARAVLEGQGIHRVDGILLDLGVSSYQFDNGDRGFSYRTDAPLDMRMDTRQGLTAEKIVNEYAEADIFHIIRDYGEERFAQNIAKHIVEYRKNEPIRTTGQLNEIIKASIPARMREKGGHPSKQTYQALRIACNHELDVLKDSLDSMIRMLNPGGRFCIITFHSLEDRIVKTTFRRNENPCTCPPDFPVCVCGKKPLGRVITRKPIIPDEKETEENPRSKSAKLRVFERNSNEQQSEESKYE